MATLYEMQRRVRRQIGNPTTEDVSDGLLREHINVAYRDIVNKYRFNLGRKICRFNTTAGVSRYTLWTDVASVLRVRNNTTETKLEKLDQRRRYELQGMTGVNMEQGKPEAYVRVRDWIELTPIPDDIYEIEVYFKVQIVDLSAEADEPVIPLAWHQGIVRLTKMLYYEEVGDDAKAALASNGFERWVARQPIEIDEEKTDYDSGVVLPTLANSSESRLDFNSSP